MAEIFEFQDDIREQIVSALQVNLTPPDKVLAERKPTDSVEAYDLFLQGRAHVHLYTQEHMLKAIESLEKAIKVDPYFAEAFGYLSYGHILGWIFMWPGFDDSLIRGNELAERAVALDSTSAMAVLRLGWAQTYLRRYDDATANLEKALTLAHENAEFYAMCGITLNWLGEPERALKMIEKAISLDALSPPTWEWNMGQSCVSMKRQKLNFSKQSSGLRLYTLTCS
jgi:tetratricopeptide (TPR) repeat protein